MHLRHKTDSPRTGVALAAGVYFSPACRNTSLATKHRSALMLPLQERLTVHESANTVNLIVRCFNFKACKAPDLCLPKWSSQLAECCGVHGILVFWLSAVAGSAGCWLPPTQRCTQPRPAPSRTSVGQESWERGGGKPQLLRLNVPAAATSGLGRPQRELELPRPADLPSSRAEAKSDRAAHSANSRPTYTGPALGLFPLPPRPESNFVGIALYMHKASEILSKRHCLVGPVKTVQQRLTSRQS